MLRRAILGAGAAGAAAAVTPAAAQDTVRWTMVMPWPRNTPGVGTSAQRFADRVQAMSGRRLQIKLYGAGELVPPFQSFDAVQSGAAQIAHGTPYYWASKAPSLHFFTGVPFGLAAPELAAWLVHGDGRTLWQEVYAQFGVVPFYAGSSGVQAGGWFKKEIRSVDDLKGLRFRIAGLGAEAMRRLGAATVTTPPGEITQSLLTGAIDAAEWIGPWNDRAFGLQKVAKFYYVPAFHEPGPGLEVIVNKAAWDELPDDLKAIVETSAMAASTDSYADFVLNNVRSFQPLIEADKVEVRTLPDEVIRALGKVSFEIYAEMAERDAMTKKVYDSFMSFLRQANDYGLRFDAELLRMRKLALPA
jgi:TRAP-type mannitol/chloroaromatic compound transport system substrate-binding protein